MREISLEMLVCDHFYRILCRFRKVWENGGLTSIHIHRLRLPKDTLVAEETRKRDYSKRIRRRPPGSIWRRRFRGFWPREDLILSRGRRTGGRWSPPRPASADKGDTRAQHHLHQRLQPDGCHAEVHFDRAELSDH